MEALHPLAVHLPIALVLVWPLVDGAGFLLESAQVSWVGVSLLGLALLTSLAATITGQAAFDVAVAAKVDPDLLGTHASDANLVPWLLLVVLVVRVVGAQKLGRRGQGLGILVGLALWPFIILVGQSGGALVFQHGVAVEVVAPAAPGNPPR